MFVLITTYNPKYLTLDLFQALLPVGQLGFELHGATYTWIFFFYKDSVVL